MIGRIVWFAALAAIALVTTALQLDLRARSRPELAPLIPAPLRNYAQERIVQGALSGPDASAALAEASRLVARRPVPAENLTLLAAAQAKAGQLEAAAQTIQVASRRGWREPLAQESMLRLALAAGDKAEAARRYAALFLGSRTSDALLEELGPAVLGGPDETARETMAAIVVGGDRWHSHFLRRGVRVMPPNAFGTITARSLAQGAAFDCGALGQSVRQLSWRDAAAGTRLAKAAAERCPDLAPADPSGL